jgi:hypothetical protein
MTPARADQRVSEARTSSRAGLVRAALVLGVLGLVVVGIRALRATEAREAPALHARAPAVTPDSQATSATLLAVPERRGSEPSVPPAQPPRPVPAPEQEATATSTGDERGSEAVERTSVDGRLNFADGSGLVDIGLRLVEAETRQVHTTRSGADGLFRFPGVAVGSVVLSIGDADEPVLPAVEALAQAPRTLLDDIVLPELGTLEVLVLDPTGQPVADASVECLGSTRGSAVATTDADGRARFAHMPAVEARAFARHASLGRANRSFAFVPGSAEHHEITLQTAGPR